MKYLGPFEPYITSIIIIGFCYLTITSFVKFINDLYFVYLFILEKIKKRVMKKYDIDYYWD